MNTKQRVQSTTHKNGVNDLFKSFQRGDDSEEYLYINRRETSRRRDMTLTNVNIIAENDDSSIELESPIIFLGKSQGVSPAEGVYADTRHPN